jgi:hypothetical protein
MSRHPTLVNADQMIALERELREAQAQEEAAAATIADLTGHPDPEWDDDPDWHLRLEPLQDRRIADHPPASVAAAEPFEGLSHDEAIAADTYSLPGGQLVEDLAEGGTVGTVAGIPETYKSWLAQQISIGVAAGKGEILGRRVLEQGSVGYFWQDDSRRNELERIQTVARVRATPRALPLRWFLNEGLRLPDDLGRLHATVERHGLSLVTLDSFYNVAGGIDLKDRDAGALIAVLKTDICDATGCAVLIVDHAPWPTESNRGQARAYGDVHKGAAIRWGIYIQRDRDKLHVEAHGNNIRGLKRSLAYWNQDTLELRLVDVQQAGAEDLDQAVLGHLAERGWSSGNELEKGVTGSATRIRASRKRLAEAGRITSASSRDLGRTGNGTYWNLAPETGFDLVPLPETNQDEPLETASQAARFVPSSPTQRGDEPRRDEPPDADEVERLAALADDDLPI